jgi:hypothetical protein
VLAPPTPPAASRATASAPILCRSRSSVSAPSRSEFSSRSTTVGGIGSSACLLQEEVNHLKVCLKVAGTHEGERRGVLFQRKPERLGLLGLSELVEALAEVCRRLIRKPDSVLSGLTGWSRSAAQPSALSNKQGDELDEATHTGVI